ncbi:MAG: acyl-CoA desaturase [Chitinophagaceae bacterium]
MSKVTFQKNTTPFYSQLKKEVDAYFKEKNLQKTGNWKLFSKSLILIPLAILTFFSLLYFHDSMPWWLSILLCAELGLTLASIGFNVMHDACHGSYSQKQWVNDLLGYSLNAMGGNSFIWKQKHNIIHHTYTNVDGIDDDIAKSPLMRQCHTQKWVPAHRYQHFYVFGVYAISSFAWIFLMDFQKYLNRSIYRTKMWEVDAKEKFVFWFSKIYYVLVFVLLPIYMVGLKLWAIGFSIMHIAMGLTLALVFQLAHVVEGAHFEEAYDDKNIENDWAIHQVVTTANFAPKNHLVRWFVGGLNYQIEHHLFPKISHVHYPAISKIVKRICSEYNIKYNEFKTTRGAIISHLKMMKEFGNTPPQQLTH